MKKFLFLSFLVSLQLSLQAQTDSTKLNLPNAFGLALDGNIPGALKLLNTDIKEPVIKKHALLRNELNLRFAQATDQSTYSSKHQSLIDDLLNIYKQYWRKSFLDYPVIYDTTLRKNLTSFLSTQTKTNLTISSSDDEIEKSLKSYIESRGFHTTGFGRTGKYFDLLVWRTEKDTTYHFTVNKEEINTPVVFMENFISLGWEEYATADRLYPGGWATDKGLYCVKQAYDLKSESFTVSYLAHEGRHFNDYKLFPGLSTPNLEYRAKLTEMTLLDTKLWDVLTFFITNANAQTKDGHQLANYYVVRDLSISLFKKDFEKDLNAWKKIPVQKIHEASINLLTANSKYLKTHKSYVE